MAHGKSQATKQRTTFKRCTHTYTNTTQPARRVDANFLFAHCEELVCLDGCLASVVVASRLESRGVVVASEQDRMACQPMCWFMCSLV